MGKYIDAHVHLVPEDAVGKRFEPLDSELAPYGFRHTHEGDFYALPPYMHDSQFTADTLVKMMDVYGVEYAVIQQTPLSPQNEATARAVEKYPDRLAGAMMLAPAEGWQAEMDYWFGRGLKSIKFEMRSYACEKMFPFVRYNEPPLLEMFRKAGSLGMTVTIDTAPVNFDIYTPDALYEAVSACPDTRFVICHMGYPLPVDTPERKEKWRKMIAIAALPNCWLDLCAMPDFFDAEGWPFPTALSLLGEVKKAVGCRKLLWGSDIPGTLNRATYPQMQEMFRRADLTEEELVDIYYNNALTAYTLPLK